MTKSAEALFSSLVVCRFAFNDALRWAYLDLDLKAFFVIYVDQSLPVHINLNLGSTFNYILYEKGNLTYS